MTSGVIGVTRGGVCAMTSVAVKTKPSGKNGNAANEEFFHSTGAYEPPPVSAIPPGFFLAAFVFAFVFCGRMVSPRASMATSDAIFLVRPAAVFMLLVRSISAKSLPQTQAAESLPGAGVGVDCLEEVSGQPSADASRMGA